MVILLWLSLFDPSFVIIFLWLSFCDPFLIILFTIFLLTFFTYIFTILCTCLNIKCNLKFITRGQSKFKEVDVVSSKISFCQLRWSIPHFSFSRKGVFFHETMLSRYCHYDRRFTILHRSDLSQQFLKTCIYGTSQS